MSSHIYKLKYSLDHESGEFQRSDAPEYGGLTDALMVVSCLYPEDGTYSQNFWTFDGRNEGQALPPNDVFKIWMMLGQALVNRSTELPPRNQSALLGGMDEVRRIVFGGAAGTKE